MGCGKLEEMDGKRKNWRQRENVRGSEKGGCDSGILGGRVGERERGGDVKT